MGARAFELENITYYSGCTGLPYKTECENNTSCKFSETCGCIPKKCNCSDDCCIYDSCTPEPEVCPAEPDKCTSRCAVDTECFKSKIIVTMIEDSTSLRPGAAPAKFNISLPIDPVENVVIELYVDSTELNITSPIKLVFSPQNWSIPQTVTVQGVYLEDRRGLYDALVSMTSSSQDGAFNRLEISPVEIHVYDYFCEVQTAPTHGIIDSCNNIYGGMCNFSCAEGYGPVTVTQLYCNEGEWIGTPLNCTECLYSEGYFKQGERTCTQCSSGECPIGYYRSNCSQTQDSNCMPCTSKPLHAVYIANQTGMTHSPCDWTCEPGYFLRNEQCVPCSVASCPTGTYREQCSSNSDGACTSCTSMLPEHSHFSSGGMPYDADNCQW